MTRIDCAKNQYTDLTDYAEQHGFSFELVE